MKRLARPIPIPVQPTPEQRRAARSQLVRMLAEQLVREAVAERSPDKASGGTIGTNAAPTEKDDL